MFNLLHQENEKGKKEGEIKMKYKNLVCKFVCFNALLILIIVGNSYSQNPETKEYKDSVESICDFTEYAPIQIRHFPKELIVKKVMPIYPQDAVEQRIEGVVYVKVLINEKGIVENACAYSGNKIFWEETEKAVLLWKFEPKYGFAFSVQRLDKPEKKRYAFAILSFTFKLPE